ncbi:hypothetical protein GCM10023191_087650 [Actinoallomurus oryzae]|uniref:Uncharacterized protein n=1 Tax=Actinoallomurus oryzae TaxID=502180 RepID=A0ABP8R2H3_9ACTN
MRKEIRERCLIESHGLGRSAPVGAAEGDDRHGRHATNVPAVPWGHGEGGVIGPAPGVVKDIVSRRLPGAWWVSGVPCRA